MDLVYWDHSYNIFLLVNFAIIIGLFASLRLFSGTIAHVNASDELLKKHNPAFGVSLAGVTFAVTLLLSGTIYGEPGQTLFESGVSVAVYGIVGIILMALTRIVFDKITLPAVSLRNEISKGNMAVAIADTSNVIAAAVIIRAIMIWIPVNTMNALLILIAGYVISQVILTGMTALRRFLFTRLYKDNSIQKELESGNIALALSFAGRKIGTAFAITVAANLIVYEVYNLTLLLVPWIGVSLLVILLLKVISALAERIILWGVDINDEIMEERNMAVGAMKGIIYLAMAILLAEL